jgi:hypothetical protein
MLPVYGSPLLGYDELPAKAAGLPRLYVTGRR